MFVCSSIAQNNPPSLTFKSHAFSPVLLLVMASMASMTSAVFLLAGIKKKMSVPLFFFDILNLMLTKNAASAITESAAF